MIRRIAVASAAVLPFGAAVDAEEGGALSMAHGIYVEAGIECAGADSSTIVSYWGDRLNSAHVVGHIREVAGDNHISVVTLDLEGDAGMGGDLRNRVEWQVITDEGGALLIDNGNGPNLYRWCAANIEDLAQIQRGQAETPPIRSVGEPDWVPMQELRTGIEPPDNVIVRIWNDVLKSEADAIRSGDGQLYVRGELTTLPDDGFRPTDFLWAKFETDDATYFVSVMGQRPPACDNGPNSATSTTIHSVCPARLTTIPKDGSDITTVEQAGACAIWPSQAVGPEPNTGSFAKIDGNLISLEAVQDGAPIPDCSLNFSLLPASAADEQGAVSPDADDANAPAFVGVWGYAMAEGENETADGIKLEVCADFNTIEYRAGEAESMHVLMEFDSYGEVAPSHWRIDAANVYEGSRFPLSIDLYVESDTMREVITGEDGHLQEAELVRCE